MTTLWHLYAIERFFSFEKILQTFICDVGAFWECHSGFLLYQSKIPQNILFLSKQKIIDSCSHQSPSATQDNLIVISAIQREKTVVILCNYGFFMCSMDSDKIHWISSQTLKENYQIDPDRISKDIIAISSKGFLFKDKQGYQIVSFDDQTTHRIPVGAHHIDLFSDCLGAAWCEKDGDIVYRYHISEGTIQIAGQTLLPVTKIQCSNYPTIAVSSKKEHMLWSGKTRCEIPISKPYQISPTKDADAWIVEDLQSSLHLSNNRAAININGIIHNYILDNENHCWKTTYFLSDNTTGFDIKPQIEDDSELHYGNIIGFTHDNTPIRKTNFGSCSEPQIEFGYAPNSVSQDSMFLATGVLLNRYKQEVIQYYNHFDIKKVFACNNGHILVFSDQIVLVNLETEYSLDFHEYNIIEQDIIDVYFENNTLVVVVQIEDQTHLESEMTEDLSEESNSEDLSEESNSEESNSEENKETHHRIYIDNIEDVFLESAQRTKEFEFLYVDGWYCTDVFRLEDDSKMFCNENGLVFLN